MKFTEILTKELRAKSKKQYLFEEIGKDYRKQMIDIFQKSIQDEVFSGVAYTRIAEQIKGFKEAEIAELFIKHAKEELNDHYFELMEYASKVGILQDLCIKFNFNDYNLPDFNDINNIIKWKQDLENEALQDYLNAAELARKEGDLLTMDFFKEISSDESNHINDLLKYTDIGSEYLNI